MKVTLGQVLEAQAALGRLSQERLPIKTAYWITKLVRLCTEEVKTFMEARSTAITECDVANGDTIDVRRPGYAAFKAKMDDLVAVEIDLAWTPLEYAKLADVSIAAADLLALEPFFAGTLDEPPAPKG